MCARRELEQLQEEFLALLQSSAESRVQVTQPSDLSCSSRTFVYVDFSLVFAVDKT